MNAKSPITKSPITKSLSTDEVPGYLADRPVLRELVDPTR
jgi:hypothetical protein